MIFDYIVREGHLTFCACKLCEESETKFFKLDKRGTQLWQATVKGQGVVTALTEFTNGGFVAGSRRVLLMMDKDRKVLWRTRLQLQSNHAGITCIQPRLDGGVLVADDTGLLLRFDKNGEAAKDMTQRRERTRIMTVHEENSFLFLGGVGTKGIGSVWRGVLKKLTKDGDVVWSKTIQACSGLDNAFTSLQLTNDGGIVAGNALGALVQVDADGNKLWSIEANGFPVRIFKSQESGQFFAFNPSATTVMYGTCTNQELQLALDFLTVDGCLELGGERTTFHTWCQKTG